jgi:hypothetical protein
MIDTIAISRRTRFGGAMMAGYGARHIPQVHFKMKAKTAIFVWYSNYLTLHTWSAKRQVRTGRQRTGRMKMHQRNIVAGRTASFAIATMANVRDHGPVLGQCSRSFVRKAMAGAPLTAITE